MPSTATVLGIKTGQEIRAYHDIKKLEQKLYGDKKCRRTLKKIKSGDKILIKLHKTTIKPPFDPNPYEITNIKGSQIKAIRDNAIHVRDKSHVKLLKRRPIDLTPTWQQQNLISSTTRNKDFDTEIQLPTKSEQATTTHLASFDQTLAQAVVDNNTPDSSMPLLTPSSSVTDKEVEYPIIHVDIRLASRLSSLLTSTGLIACETTSSSNTSTQTKSDCKLRKNCKLITNGIPE